jgi:flavin reductase (DIM6/NTAB) family NADH-FMN oxidoreductase RutF
MSRSIQLDGQPHPVSPQDFRRVFGHFATGLAVITSVHRDEPVGMVANSVTSVSLDPPLVLFCPSHASTTWPRIKESGGYVINVLGDGSAGLPQRMTSSDEQHLHGAAHALSSTGRPVLDEAIAWIDCEIEDEHPAGDHVISVGRVVELEERGGRPLLFFRSTYRQLLEDELPFIAKGDA